MAAWKPWQPGEPPRHAGGRRRSPISPQQAAHLATIGAGNINRPNLQPARHRWHGHRNYQAAYRQTLADLERRWQDDLLANASAVDIATYTGLLADDTGIIPRLRHLRRTIRRAENLARQQRPKTMPSWEQVRSQVYAESAGLLQL